jgi:hypothetical protein
LKPACDALASKRANLHVRVEDAATTAKAIVAGNANIDAWLTLQPWPAIVDQLAGRRLTGDGTTIASSPLEIDMVAERAAALTASCGGVNWRCLGDAIGQPWTVFGGQPEWGLVKVGLPPITSASGLLLFANAVSGFFGRTDIATNDFGDDAFATWRVKVRDATTKADDPFSTFILQFPAAFSAVGAVHADAASKVGARVSEVASFTPAPPATAVVVLAPIGSTDPSGLARDAALTDTLKGMGWSTDARDPPTGLPDAGVLLALSSLTG